MTLLTKTASALAVIALSANVALAAKGGKGTTASDAANQSAAAVGAAATQVMSTGAVSINANLSAVTTAQVVKSLRDADPNSSTDNGDIAANAIEDLRIRGPFVQSFTNVVSSAQGPQLNAVVQLNGAIKVGALNATGVVSAADAKLTAEEIAGACKL